MDMQHRSDASDWCGGASVAAILATQHVFLARTYPSIGTYNLRELLSDRHHLYHL